MKKNWFLFTCLIILIGSCGIFQPRDIFEAPDLTGPQDRFRFGEIFDKIGVRYTWESYDAFFHDTMRFTDMNSGEFNKKSIITHLQQIEHQYPKFRIKWSTIEKCSEDGSILYINGIEYTILYDSTIADGNNYTGVSNMVITRDGKYRVTKWDDFSDGQKKSFFAPD